MIYTAKERKTIRHQLKAALAIFGIDNRSRYICDNVRFANMDATGAQFADPSCDITTNMIVNRINGDFGVDVWLRKLSPQIDREVRDDIMHNRGKKVQAYRRAWLESLIAEFA